MAPFSSAHSHIQRSVETAATATTDQFTTQWMNPSDIFSVLLLLGPEVVQQAVAQLAGRAVTPVAFSFGWVAYSTKALLTVIGDGQLMPPADMTNIIVIGAKSGHVRSTSAWVLGRLLRDLDDRLDAEMKDEQPHVPPGSTAAPATPPPAPAPSGPAGTPWEALRISVYEVIDEPGYLHGVPHIDCIWLSGVVVIVIQLVVSIIPWVVNGEWGTFLITAAGNLLALLGASLSKWREEKWSCPKKGGATVILTQGNGSRHAIVILGKKGVGLDLEILARGTRTAPPSQFTRATTAILAILWIGLLITAAGQTTRTWYLLGIGALGSVQNVICAGAPRSPSALGVHIKDTQRPIRGTRVAEVLKMAEEQYPDVGLALVPVFFPGSMRVKDDEDLKFWRDAQERRMAPNRFGKRIDAYK